MNTRTLTLTSDEIALIQFYLPTVADVNQRLPSFAADKVLALRRKLVEDDQPTSGEPPLGSLDHILAMNVNPRCIDCATE